MEAKRRLADRAGISLGADTPVSGDFRQSIYRALAKASELYTECLFHPHMGASARAYLSQRGISEESARRFGLGYAPPAYDWLLHQAKRSGQSVETLLSAKLVVRNDRGNTFDFFRGRLMFAIRDERKRTVGFAGRVLPGSESEGGKYINSPASTIYQKNEVLYGLDHAIDAFKNLKPGEPRRLVIVEGYTDCIMAWQHGFPFVVASCGTALTANHVRKIRQYADTVVLMFDGDKAGQKAIQSAMELFLASDLLVRIAVPPDSMDPCDFLQRHGLLDWIKLLDTAPDCLKYALDSVRSRHSFATVEGRLSGQEEMAAMLAALPVTTTAEQRIRFDATVNELVAASGVEERVLRIRIDELRKSRGKPRSVNLTPQSDKDSANQPMDRRTRMIVQWIVAQPGVAVERLGDLLEPDELKHAGARKIVLEAFQLVRELGRSATCDQLRERMNDPIWDQLIVDLLERVPNGTEYEAGLTEIAATLVAERNKRVASSARQQLSADSEDQDHLEWIRRGSQSHRLQSGEFPDG
jgi:DNA primase